MDGRRERGRAGGAATTELFSGFFLALSPDLVYFHKDEIIKVWDCVSECYRQDLLLKKRVGLMGLGTIHIMKRPIWHGEGEGFMADSPEFDLNNPLLVGKKLIHGKSPVPGLSKADELVCAEVALRLHKPKATIVMCIKATLRICEWALSSGQNFDFVFRDIGVLVCRGHHVSMRFFEGLVRDVAQSQHLADGLLQSPNLKPLFIAHTEKDISQIPPGGVFVLPHFVQADGKSQPHPVSAFLQDTGSRKTNTKRQTLGNLPSPHLLLRPHLSPSRIYDVKAKGREKKRADSGVQRGSLLPPVENSVKKGRASKGMEEPKARLAASTIQGKPVQQLPPRAEQRSLKKAAAFSPGRFERLRKERVAAVAGVAAALSPEGRKEKKTPSPRRRTPEPRSPRAKQVLLNLQPYKAAREQCMKALQINKLRKWSNAGSLAPGSKLSLVKKLEVHEETTAELEHRGSYVAP